MTSITITFIITSAAIVEAATDKTEIDLISVMQQLSSEDIEDLPPGGGLASK